MYRKIIENLIDWKKNPDRKPLVIKGARQVGKSYIMQEFGKNYFDSFVYINFDSDSQVGKIFDVDKNPERIVDDLSIYVGKKIEKNKTLIILDEIQFCENALNSLKYFYEKAKEYYVICAGSLLGTYLKNEGISYPVGCINVLEMFPLSFEEFVMEMDENVFNEYTKTDIFGERKSLFHNQLNELYKKYLMIGGMPECVKSYKNNKDMSKVRSIQNELISLYENDISKYNGKVDAGKMLAILRNIPSQLAKENKKFMYKNLRSGARASDYSSSIEWLISAGLIIKVCNISSVKSPIKAYSKENEFKLYLFDVGLLCAMVDIDNASILLDGDYSFKGAITENYVVEQLKSINIYCAYYSEKEQEIDFIYEKNMNIIPIEVKSTKNLISTSFKNFIKKYDLHGIRFSMLEGKAQESFFDMPLYMVNSLETLNIGFKR